MHPAKSEEPEGSAVSPDQHTSQDIEDFIYLISHDVRGSVRALLELPQWIAEDLEDAGIKVEGPVASSIELMNRHTGRLDRMLVDLLTYSRIGRMQDVHEIALDDALDEVLEEMSVPSGFTVVRALDCPTVHMGDRDLLTLLNALIVNGFKHHDRSRGRIIVGSHRENDRIVLTVTDDGPGIPAEYCERVFGPMTTLRPRDEVEGSGMGLANVRKIAVHYGGHTVIAPSLHGRGSQVQVYLPAMPNTGK